MNEKREEKLRRMAGPPRRRRPASPLERLKGQVEERCADWTKVLESRKRRLRAPGAKCPSRQGTVEYAAGVLAGFMTAHEMIQKLEKQEACAVPGEAAAHADLECPECGRMTRCGGLRRDGGGSYRCLNVKGHANFWPISFFINGDGELFF